MTKDELVAEVTELLKPLLAANKEVVGDEAFVFFWVPMADLKELPTDELVERCGRTAVGLLVGEQEHMDDREGLKS